LGDVADEAALRRRISREVWRALADPEYARALLADPARILDDSGWTLRQQHDLASIRASNVQEFARQAELLFWPGRASKPYARGTATTARAAS
jgi:hypothetical protein